MAIRYSGDVEVRVSYRDGKYHAALRAPGLRAKGVLPRSSSLRARTATSRDPQRGDPRSPEAYDAAALAFLKLAKREGFPVYTEGGQISFRRTFQAPCPYRT